MNLLGFLDYKSLKAVHNQWVKSGLDKTDKKNSAWTKSIAVGDEQFIEKIRGLLGTRPEDVAKLNQTPVLN
jgi:hypothetical protein